MYHFWKHFKKLGAQLFRVWATDTTMDSIFSVISSHVSWDVQSLLLFTAVFILTTDYIKNRQPASFPPGPWRLPILGNMFTVDHGHTHESMTEVNLKV